MAHPVDWLDSLDQQLIADQVNTYKQLHTTLSSVQHRNPQLLEDLAELQSTLLDADEAVLARYDCLEANHLFLQAFRIDPHNNDLYWLSDLMGTLAEVAHDQPDAWEVECASLQQEATYQFPAAQAYLDRAKRRITDTIQETIEWIRMGLLDTPIETLRDASQAWSNLPTAIQGLTHICNGYWHLYDYGDQHRDVFSRLRQAQTELASAKQIFAVQTAYADLNNELIVFEKLLQIYQTLSETEDQDFAPLRAELETLPPITSHAFAKRIERELDSLDSWKSDYEKVLNLCLKHQYGNALTFVEERLSQNQDAYQWLASAITPDVTVWQTFCQNARDGRDAWQKHDFEQAETHFLAALNEMPIYTNGLEPAPLKQELQLIVQAVQNLQTNLAGNLSLLMEADSFDGYRRIPENLRKVQELEETYLPAFGGEPFIAATAQRAEKFVELAREGLVEEIDALVADAKQHNDGLVSGYRRIARVIRWGMQTDQLGEALSNVDTALEIAPNSRQLISHKRDIGALLKTISMALDYLENGDVVQTNEILSEWEQQYRSLPEPLNCINHISAGYDHLVGGAGKSLSSVERINNVAHYAQVATDLYTDDSLTRLGQEVKILTTLLEQYQSLYQGGLGILQDNRDKLNAFRETDAVLSQHSVVGQVDRILSHLSTWLLSQQTIVEDLEAFRYPEALKRLRQIPMEEKQALYWLNDEAQPQWAAWEQFCLNVQTGQTQALARSYKQARTQIVLAARQVPADTVFGEQRHLSNRLNDMVRNLVLLETRVNDSLSLLTKATEPQIYDLVAEKLAEAAAVEEQYFPGLTVDSLTVTTIANRFQQFTVVAQQGDDAQMQSIITQADQDQDPLSPGYQTIKKIIEQGHLPDALPAQIANALKLAPNSRFLATSIDQIESSETIDLVLTQVQQANLDQAADLLARSEADKSSSQQITNLGQVVAGYQALYSDESKQKSPQARIADARTCISAAQEDLGSQLLQELNVLRTLVVGYNRIHARRWSDLDQVLKQQPRSHALVNRLDGHIEALQHWSKRRYDILESWKNQEYLRTWELFEDRSEAELELLGWLDEPALRSWETWFNFGYAIWQGFQDWQLFRYAESESHFEEAIALVPLDLEPDVRTKIQTDVETLKADLARVTTHTKQAGQLLALNDANEYDNVSQELHLAREIENTYRGTGKMGIDSAERLLERFTLIERYLVVGNTDRLGKLIQESYVYKEPFGKTYDQMMNTIILAKRPQATAREVELGLSLAPQAPFLIKRQQQQQRRRNLFAGIIFLFIIFAVIGIVAFMIY
ncbi:MAG: hypothetical protein AAF629_12275 [Chloroflexota bacterium]